MGHAKGKGVSEHAQNALIQIHPTHAQTLIRALASIKTFCSGYSELILFPMELHSNSTLFGG